jgi:metallo-beta-lactamase family protein
MIKLKFFGAAQNVTGSSYYLEVGNTRILVDCGLYQEREFRYRNWDPFPVPPEKLDALLLTHAHLDHCGLLPKLFRDGFRGKVYCTAATSDIARIILLDSAKLQEEDARYKRKRHEREGRKGPFPENPLYTVSDAEATLSLFSPVRYGQNIEVGDGIRASFHDAGHVFGSSMIMAYAKQDGKETSLLFSGDVGRWNKPILRDPTVFSEADYIVVESTYGDRSHGSSADIGNHLTEAVLSTLEAGGNIIVPSFALERAQEIIYYLHELLIEHKIPPLMVFLDSPMAVSITEVFQRHPELYDREMAKLVGLDRSPFDFPGLEMTRTRDESKAINYIKGTSIIIAGSGMCTGGRVKHHLANNISRAESTVLFIGYQARGTLGREIIDGARKVRIFGVYHPVRARITQIQGFSAHADRDELLKWLSGLIRPPQHVFVTHGEPEAATAFSNLLREGKGWNTSVPDYREEVVLDPESIS